MSDAPTSGGLPRRPTEGGPVLGRADQPDRVRATSGGSHQIPRADAGGAPVTPAASGAPRTPVRPIVPPVFRPAPANRPVPPIRVAVPAPTPARVVPAPRPAQAKPVPPPVEPRIEPRVEPVVEPVVERAPPPPERPSSVLATADSSLLGREGESVPAGAARELARAFQASAEALQGIHRLHSDLAQSMRRADRSELVLQSTNALNETFRNLATVQRRLLERLDAPPSGAQRMLPLMLVALLVVFVGGIAAVVHLIDVVREERTDPVAYHQQVDAARLQGAKEASAANERELLHGRKELEEYEAKLATLQASLAEREREFEAVQSEARTLETQRDELGQEALRLRSEGAARKAVEDELRAVRTKLDVLEPRQKQLEFDLAAERTEKQRLQQLIAQARLGIDVGSGAGAEEPGPESAVPPPAPASAGGPAVSRDVRQIEMIRGAVNKFLETRRGRGEYWQVASIRGVSADRLHDVAILHYDDRGRLLDSVESRELAIWVDRAKRIVEFEFRDGHSVFAGTKTPFRDGSLRKTVAEGEDAVGLWMGSGLLILRTR